MWIKCHPIIYYFATVLLPTYTKVLEERNLEIDREVTAEENNFEYNVEHGHGNEDGDMMLSQEQMEWMKSDGNERALWPWNNWPRTGSYVNIPYTKDEHNPWGSHENGIIQAAIDSRLKHRQP